MTNEPAHVPLIVCAGERVNGICGSIVHRIPTEVCRIVMSEWIDDETLSRASILWVVDDAAEKRDVLRGMRLGVPMLVPEVNRALREICVNGKCGIYYATCDDAEGAIFYLLENESVRKTMGDNARQYCAIIGSVRR